MGTATTGSIEYHRSFCGKEQKQVERLIASLGGVYICDNYVELCTEIIREGRFCGRRRGLSLPQNRTLDALQGPKIGDAFGRRHEGWGSRSLKRPSSLPPGILFSADIWNRLVRRAIEALQGAGITRTKRVHHNTFRPIILYPKHQAISRAQIQRLHNGLGKRQLFLLSQLALRFNWRPPGRSASRPGNTPILSCRRAKPPYINTAVQQGSR